MITFIHTGDVHLGMIPDKDKPWSLTRKKEIWETFRRLIEETERKHTDLLLISGDLFHRQPTEQELREVDYLFSSLTHTKVIMIAGNHDYIRPMSGYDGFEWSDNVIFLAEEEMQKVEIPEYNLDVYGFSYHTREIYERRMEELMIENPDKVNLLLVHGGDKEHLPLSFTNLGTKGFSYIALGHIHQPMFRKDLNMAYCGSLEPLHVDDKGKRGYIEGIMDENGVTFDLIPFSKRCYQEIALDITGIHTLMELGDILKKQIFQFGEDNLYILRVVGFCEPDLTVTEEFLSSYGNIARIIFRTKMHYDFEKLMKENHDNMLGLYIKTFWQERMNPQEEKALYYGVKALIDSQDA